EGESLMLVATYSGLVSRWTGHTRDVTEQSSTFPVVLDSDVQTFANTTGNVGVVMPDTVAAGNLLIVVLTYVGGLPDAPTGWTRIDSKGLVYAKVAVGDEDGTTVNFNRGSVAYNHVARVYRIGSWWDDLTSGVKA